MVPIKNILEIDSVFLKLHDNVLLSNIYIKIQTQKITGLLGRNGTGKTILLEMLYGTFNEGDKSIRLNSIVASNLYYQKGIINFLPQKNFIPGFLNLMDVFDYFLIDIKEFILLFPEFHGNEKLKINLFSGGQKKIIELYLIVKSKTAFSLLDEPFSYLMPAYVDTFISLIKNESSRKGFLVTDHLYNKIIAISDDLYLLEAGKSNLINDLRQLSQLGYLPIDHDYDYKE